MSQERTTAGILLFKIEAIRHNFFLRIHRNKAKKNKALRMIILFYVKKIKGKHGKAVKIVWIL